MAVKWSGSVPTLNLSSRADASRRAFEDSNARHLRIADRKGH